MLDHGHRLPSHSLQPSERDYPEMIKRYNELMVPGDFMRIVPYWQHFQNVGLSLLLAEVRQHNARCHK